MLGSFALLMTPAVLTAPHSTASTVEDVIAAERAFAAAARQKGFSAALRAAAAPDAILFTPGPRPAAPLLDRPTGPEPSILWWPLFAGIAASGDLGFATGPFIVETDGGRRHGTFFTVWRRQPDGSWRWVLDNGPPASGPSQFAPGTPVTALPESDFTPGPADRAGASLHAAEAALNAALGQDAPRALAAALLDDGQVLRTGPQPAVGRAAFAPALRLGPQRFQATHLGGGTSSAGDLAYAYGRIGWLENGGPASAHYLRIWQRRADGWRLAIDNIVRVPLRAKEKH